MGGGSLANLLRSQQQNKNFFESLFFKKKIADEESPSLSPKSIVSLSPLANSVVSRCSKILNIRTEELQHQFETGVPDNLKQPSNYARNLLEFCSFQALHVVTANAEYLGDNDFCRFTYDIMLAWEAPGVENKSFNMEVERESSKEVEGEDGWSLFYSSTTSMAVQVDEKQTVGSEAFARIAPACAVIADVITVQNLFDALTNGSEHRLHFLIYDKYLRMLEKYALPP